MSSRFSESQEDTVRSLAAGDKKVLERIYKEAFPIVEKMVYKYNGHTEDAMDVFQEVMTIVYQKACDNKLVLECKLSTYIVALAKYNWLNKLRDRKKSNTTLWDDNDDTENQLYNISDELSAFEQKEKNAGKIVRCLDEIGEPCASILKDFYLKNKTMLYIAEYYGYSNTVTAKTQKYKCLNRFRKLFNDIK